MFICIWPHKVYIFLTSMTRRVDLAMSVCTDMAKSTRLVILIKYIYTLRFLLIVKNFPTNLVYPFTLRLTGIKMWVTTSDYKTKRERYSRCHWVKNTVQNCNILFIWFILYLTSSYSLCLTKIIVLKKVREIQIVK